MTTFWSRRGALAVSGAGALALALPVPGAAAQQSAPAGEPLADDFSALRGKWRDLLLGQGFSPTAEPFRTKLAALGSTARGYMSAMAPAEGSLWPDNVYADPDPDKDTESYTYSAQIQNSYGRLRTMAEAYAQPGTGLTGDPALLASVLTGIGHLGTQVYNESQAPYGNWYNWQIGAPQALLDICLILDDHLSGDLRSATARAIDHFVPDSSVAAYSGTSTGANRIDLCRVLALRGALDGTAAKVALARDAVSPVFPYVTSGDGLYADGSLVQHTWVPYTGSYGAVLIDGLSKLFALLGDSAWAITDPQRQIFLDSVEHAYAPFLHDGLMMDGVSGRAISRGLVAGAPAKVQQDDHLRGHAVIASILLLGQGAGAEENARWRALAKGWFSRDRYSDVTTGRTLGVAPLSRVIALLGDSSVRPAPEPSGHRVFPGMDRAVHRTRDFTASVSMASSRITYYENGNGENLRAWHTGSGMLYWWGPEGEGQYSDGYWPTVDPYRLPGTTASAKPLADGEGGIWGAARPDAVWAGGASDGTFASLGQHLKGLSSTLEAKKSWFFLGDCVVCLGAGITCGDGARVETVVDNRSLGADGTAGLTVDGRTRPGGAWSGTLNQVRWAHLAGHAGYVFPGGTTLTGLREERTGTWKAINGGGSADPVTRRYLTLLADHGEDPKDAEYAYILMPGASRARTAARAADPRWLDILANSGAQQGVRVPSSGFTGINFFAAGTVGPVTADAPVSVQIHEKRDGTAVVCVADPGRTVKGLTLTWRRRVHSVLTRPDLVTGVGTGSVLTLRFGDLSATNGVTQTVRVRTV
ncbi:polysaccharide lyase 8 family protein [Streptomyces sp. NPDC051064]|uniref:polysaccharide lyase 8 family protein n=1 Tax=Streptomyces sp. NPDC051064 TaxID=3365641 RepID=UPI0037A58606